jgi:hypothetical protein
MKNQKTNQAGKDFDVEINASSPSFFAELFGFIKSHKKWWLTPIIIVVVVFGILVLLSATGAAPFIYTLF